MDNSRIEHAILCGVSGSRAYGTNREDSDWDYRGIVIAPIPNYCGFVQPFKASQKIQTYPDGRTVDLSLYDITKFFSLASAGNPSMLELLWLPKYVKYTYLGSLLLQYRQKFLSKKIVASFLGMAVRSLKLKRVRRTACAMAPTRMTQNLRCIQSDSFGWQ